jgi:23S rRNA (cytosine1962-C5)-methyltransferase
MLAGSIWNRKSQNPAGSGKSCIFRCVKAKPRATALDPATTAVVAPRGRRRIEGGHPWVFRQDIESGPATDALNGGPSLVTVVDDRNQVLGHAMWAATSPVALRMLMGLVQSRFAAALEHRTTMGIAPGRSAYRVLHAEGDDLPGLFVDKYEDVAVLQVAAVALEPLIPAIAEMVESSLKVKMVVARNDTSMRDFEGLPRQDSILRGQGETTIRYWLGPNQLQADLLRDGKTGGFLDQAENHAFVASLSKPGGRSVDAFTFHGGFALALARKSSYVLAADADLEASRRTKENAAINGLSHMEVRCTDAYQLLATLESGGQLFDTVVLDPPAFAKRSGAVVAAERAYHELIVRGIRVAAPGALLVACSCSGQVDRGLWDRLVGEAAATAGRAVQVLARRGAGLDHPERLGVPETGHLKTWVMRVL